MHVDVGSMENNRTIKWNSVALKYAIFFTQINGIDYVSLNDDQAKIGEWQLSKTCISV